MKINHNSQDLKIINWTCEYNCFSACVLNSAPHLCWCCLLCRSGKVWIEDIFNSDIFRL